MATEHAQPVNPGRQVHTYPTPTSSQVPWFWHGFRRHSWNICGREKNHIFSYFTSARVGAVTPTKCNVYYLPKTCIWMSVHEFHLKNSKAIGTFKLNYTRTFFSNILTKVKTISGFMMSSFFQVHESELKLGSHKSNTFVKCCLCYLSLK